MYRLFRFFNWLAILCRTQAIKKDPAPKVTRPDFLKAQAAWSEKYYGES
jgi:hypothetical protein